MSDMIFYIPSIENVEQTANLSAEPKALEERFLDYIFIYYKKDYKALSELPKQIRRQDVIFGHKGREYTQEHKNLFLEKCKVTKDRILDMDLGELLLGKYKPYRMKIPINWEMLFKSDELDDADVEDVQRLRVEDIFDEESVGRGKAYKLVGEQDPRLRQKMNRISKGKGISDKILTKRISEKGVLNQLEPSAQKMKWEISIPLIEPESPLSNQKIIRDAGLSFRTEPQDDVVREGKKVDITWSVPKEKLNLSEIENDSILHQELMDLFLQNPPIADIFHNKDEGIGGYHPYEDVRQNMSVKIIISFRKTQVKLSSIGQEIQTKEGSNISIPITIQLNTLLENTFTFGTGGKEIKGKQKEKTLAELKDELLFLKEELDRADEEEQIKIQQQISDLQEAIKVKEDEGEEASEEAKEEEEKEAEKDEPKYEKGEVIPELKLYFDTIKSRINKLEKAIEEINRHEVEV